MSHFSKIDGCLRYKGDALLHLSLKDYKRLLKDNTREFNKEWGSPEFTFDGNSVWKRYLGGFDRPIFVCTGPEGTTFHVPWNMGLWFYSKTKGKQWGWQWIDSDKKRKKLKKFGISLPPCDGDYTKFMNRDKDWGRFFYGLTMMLKDNHSNE